jgi:hypothetical protein
MGNFRIVVLLALAACQPMYGAKPQKLRSPEPIKPPAGLPGDDGTATKPPFDEQCDFFTSKGVKVKRETAAAERHTQNGDQKVADFDAAPPAAKSDLIIDGIDEYAAALRKDPFNAKATLKLARAYDKVRRKGCALALLERLDQLAQNPKFKTEANEAIDEIMQRGNRTWFDGYRKDALRIVGRTGP